MSKTSSKPGAGAQSPPAPSPPSSWARGGLRRQRRPDQSPSRRAWARATRSPSPPSASSATTSSSRSGTPRTPTSRSSRPRSPSGTTGRTSSTPACRPARASPTSSRSRATSCPRSSPRPTGGSTFQRRGRGPLAGVQVDRATTDDGKLLGYATDAGPEAICYRADLFEKAGLPSDREEVAALMTTWDDYFALGEQFVAESTPWYDSSARSPRRCSTRSSTPSRRTTTRRRREPELQESTRRSPVTPTPCRRGRPVERRLDGHFRTTTVRHHPLPGLDAQHRPRQHR